MDFLDEYYAQHDGFISSAITDLLDPDGNPKFKVFDRWGGEVTNFPFRVSKVVAYHESRSGTPGGILYQNDFITLQNAIEDCHAELAAMLINLYFSRLTREECCSLCNILSIADSRLSLTNEISFTADQVRYEWNARHPESDAILKNMDYIS